MQQRRSEQRPARLIKGDLWTLRVGAVEIVQVEAPEDGEQRFIVAAVDPDGVIRCGVGAVGVRREIFEIELIREEREVGVQAPIGIIFEIELHAMLELQLIAVGIDVQTGQAVAGFVGVEVVEVVEAEPGNLLRVSLAGVDQIQSHREAAARTDVEAPLGKQPGSFVFPGHRIALTAEHDAVGVEYVGTPVRARAWSEVVAERAVERLAQVGKPENRGVTGVELEVFEGHPVARIDRRPLRAHPVVRILHVMSGDPGVLTDENSFLAVRLRSEFSRLEDDGIHRDPQACAVEDTLLVLIDRPVAALEHVALID